MHILRDEALRDGNTLRLPARACALIDLDDVRDIPAACEWARHASLGIIPMGQGSNVVLAGDLDALVLRLQNRGIDLLEEDAGSVLLRVAGGEDWHSLVEWCLGRGYFGLENLALIPGTAGAAPVQNIGAYGVELQSCLERVHATELATGRAQVLTAGDCQFGYRHSIFKARLRDRMIITAIELRLSRRANVDITYPALASFFRGRSPRDVTPCEVFDAVVSIRRSRLPDPSVLPNAGSFFKNPLLPQAEADQLVESFPGLPVFPQGWGMAKLPAAWLIEHCGWKGLREGDVGVHPDHALVLVNYGEATGEQLLALAARITASVRDTFGLELAIEPRVYGEST